MLGVTTRLVVQKTAYSVPVGTKIVWYICGTNSYVQSIDTDPIMPREQIDMLY